MKRGAAQPLFGDRRNALPGTEPVVLALTSIVAAAGAAVADTISLAANPQDGFASFRSSKRDQRSWLQRLFDSLQTSGYAGLTPAFGAAPTGRTLTIVIPCRERSEPYVTLASLARQTFRDFDVIVSPDRGRGANWARNRGFRLVRTPFVLFSDDDVEWYPTAIAQMKAALDARPEASYAYGSYFIPGVAIRGNVAFDAVRLRRMNYISTMSMVRTADFSGFDESIRRLQDWDVWLTMLKDGKTGVHCGSYIFQTKMRRGITYGHELSWEEATRIVRRKHGLPPV
jgi:hypothetical protein